MDKRSFSQANWWLLFFTLLLFGTGIINLYSASSIRTEDGYQLLPYFEKQILWGFIGLGFLLVSASFNYKYLKTLSLLLLLATIVLLALVPVIGITVNNARRWISFGLFNLQPSEVAKISLTIITAVILARYKKPLDWSGLFLVGLACVVPCTLILMQPDLGTMLNLLLIVSGMIIYKGLKTSVLIINMLLLPIIGAISWFFLKDYQQERIIAFIDPAKATAKAKYHIIQSKITIGSGQMWGNSFLEGMQSKLLFLPERHTDFAIAVFSEEWGFVGSVVLITLFCCFLLCIIKTVREAKDSLGAILCAGVFFYFFWQILINIGMVSGLLPVVGIPLPFISYGGTAVIVNFIMIGLVFNVSMRRFMFIQKH